VSAHLTRRGRGVLVLAGVALLAAAAWMTVVVVREPADVAASTVDTVRTPLLSVRRVPDLVREHAARSVLQRDLDLALAGTDHCAAVADVDEMLARVNGDLPLAGASTQKLLVGAGVLDVLGPTARLPTTTLAQSPPVDGEVDDLYLVGGGDPMLGTDAYADLLADEVRFEASSVTPIEALADALAAAGVEHIDGDLLVDDSRHDDTRYLPEWKPNYRTDGESGPLGALVANGGFSVVGGNVGVADPAIQTGDLLAEALADRGIAIDGVITRGAPPPGATEIARVESAPASDLVAGLVSGSGNMSAELLTREVGVATGGDGTTAAGTTALEGTIDGLGVPAAGVDLVDGSGLAPANRVTCDALVATLALSDREPFTALQSGLSVAGESGTLGARFAGHPLAGRLRGKTGEIDGVVGLAGTVDGGRAPLFAFLANGDFSTERGHELQQSVSEIVAGFPSVPPAEAIVSAP
jgi:D-alanyl-D-alanine carboxypeptidase/D-alanyl-D-alanine-endopeptidase (penicillin-binding protein 4)